MTYDQFDLFDQYTNQTLPDAERQALEDQLRTDASLRASLHDYQLFRHSLDAVPLNKQLDRIHNRLAAQGFFNENSADRPPVPLPPTFRRRRLMLASSVMTLLLVIGAGYWFTRPTLAEQAFLTVYQPEPVARGESVCTPALLPGIQLYRTRQYEQALQQFTRLPASQPCVVYYVGLAQLALDQSEPAIKAFDATLRADVPLPTLVRQKATWYLALAYLKANQPDEARHWLTQIARQPDQPFQSVAREALDALQK